MNVVRRTDPRRFVEVSPNRMKSASARPRQTVARGRCPWPKSPLAESYHDEEWGVPITDDRQLFEFLALSNIQAGLSWEIVLRKREAFRRAFDHFEPSKVARYNRRSLARLLSDERIVRNRLKLAAVIQNARCVREIQETMGSFSNFLWQFVDGRPVVNHWQSVDDVPTKTELSDRVSVELRSRGFQFVGTTICYAFLQSVGLINDHLVTCFRHSILARKGNKLTENTR